MRRELLSLLRCPECQASGKMEVHPADTDSREIREGVVRCGVCNRERPVRAGVPDLMLNPPPEVTREAAGLERFAHEMRRDGWDRDRVLNLPYEDSGYWWAQRRSMERLLETTPFAAGQTILDIGANTCWASATFARRGMRAVALDIATVEMQGLHTAEWWFEAEGMYFERVLAEMSALPFADNSFDWVFCCEVLHHKDRCGMLATLREAHRILRPGGSLLVMNEPLRWPTDLKRDHAVEVAQFEGNEHVYFVVEYLALARLAGFRRPRAHEPAYDQFYSSEPLHLTLGAGVGGSLKLALLNIARQTSLLRRSHMWHRYLLGPDVALQMVCTKGLR